MASKSDSVAVGPPTIVAGSPGAMYMDENTRNEIPSNKNTSCMPLRTIKAIIYSPTFLHLLIYFLNLINKWLLFVNCDYRA